MGRFQTSIEIIKQSLVLIQREPKLLLFPLLNLLGIFFLVAFFVLPLILETSVISFIPDFMDWQEAMRLNRDPDTHMISPPVTFGQFTIGEGRLGIPYILLAATYLMFMFVATFINVAFYQEILQAFNGNRVSITRSFAFAASKLQAILLWSLLAGIIGLIIRKIEEKVGFFARWIVSLIGFTWSIASVLVIPVLIREKQQNNPFACLKTSAEIIKRNWGEGLSGIVSISLVTIGLVVFLIAGGLFLVVLLNTPLFLFVPILGTIALFYLASVVRNIFICGLYVYATEGVTPGIYDTALMEQAWKVKKRKQ